MGFKETLTTILTPVFGDEIYPIVHPDPDGTLGSVSNLYAVYTIIGGVSFNTLEGNTDLSRPRVQISIYSVDYTELGLKMQALNEAMDVANTLASQCVDNQIDFIEVVGALPNVSVSVPPEGFEEDTRRFYAHLDFYCWNRS